MLLCCTAVVDVASMVFLVEITITVLCPPQANASTGEANAAQDIDSVMQNAEFLSSVLGALPGVDINDEGIA